MECPCPYRAAVGGNLLWLAYAPNGRAHGGHRLVALDGFDVQLSIPTEPILGMASGREGDSICLLRSSPGAGPEWTPIDGQGTVGHSISFPGASRMWVAGGTLWILAKEGVAWSLDGQPSGWGSPRAWTLPSPIGQDRLVGSELWLRCGASSQGWGRLDPERGWVAERSDPWMPPQIASASTRSPTRRAWGEAVAIHGVSQGTGWLVEQPDSLWRMDPQGRPLWGQGGFGYIEQVLALGSTEVPQNLTRANPK